MAFLGRSAHLEPIGGAVGAAGRENVEPDDAHGDIGPHGFLDAADALVSKAGAQLDGVAPNGGQGPGVLLALVIGADAEEEDGGVFVFDIGPVPQGIGLVREQQESAAQLFHGLGLLSRSIQYYYTIDRRGKMEHIGGLAPGG